MCDVSHFFLCRCDFQQEVHVMSRLKDANIVRLLGVCTESEPLCMVVEYMRCGDLNQFLRRHVPLESTIGRQSENVLRCNTLPPLVSCCCYCVFTEEYLLVVTGASSTWRNK